MGPHEWDGLTYDRISTPLERNGLGVLDRLVLRGDETVLDAGCGSGRVTQALVERVPSGHVGEPLRLSACASLAGTKQALAQLGLLLGGRVPAGDVRQLLQRS
jgi:trans-aconitate methyltransferase